MASVVYQFLIMFNFINEIIQTLNRVCGIWNTNVLNKYTINNCI